MKRKREINDSRDLRRLLLKKRLIEMKGIAMAEANQLELKCIYGLITPTLHFVRKDRTLLPITAFRKIMMINVDN